MKKWMLKALCLCMATMLLAGGALAETPSPKDDFYEAVNAQWLSTAEIPADKPAVGGFNDLADGIEDTLMADFGAMLAGDVAPGDPLLENFIEFYRLAADYEARDAAGAAPLLPYMEMIEALDSLPVPDGEWADWVLAGMPLPFGMGVLADMGDASTNALYLVAPGLFLMDRSYYEDESIKEMLQGMYGQMSANLLMMAGKAEDEAMTIVQQALAFDERLAPYTKDAVEASDTTALYNPIALAELDAQIEGCDLASLLGALLGEAPETVIVTDPRFFEAYDLLVNDGTFEDVRSWMLVATVNSLAPYLSNDMRVESGAFNRLLMGTAEAPAPEKAAYRLASEMFSEVVGIYYGQTYFGEQARGDVRAMVEAIIDTYAGRLAANTWLSDDTRAMAIRKLEAMKLHVGYPDEARPLYSQLVTVPAGEGGTLIDNVMEFTRVGVADNLGKWNTPVDRGLWPLSASTVNAMYSMLDNSINFPAAILQAPFYSLEQSASANYGGIGAVIAHEISHAFDPNGSQFDEQGNLANWWTEADYETFSALSQAMVDEFDGLEHAGGMVNGELTVTENVADAGGLSCALEALQGMEDVDLAAFFTSWATIWRQKATPEYEALLLALDVHAPNALRANIQAQNIDEFFEAFDIGPGDGMYRAPEDRVAIW